MMRRGMASLEKEQARQSENFTGGKFIPYVRLKDHLDLVRFRPVTEPEEGLARANGTPHVLINGEFHTVPDVSATGKRFFNTVTCQLIPAEGGELTGSCVHCDEGVNRSTQFVLWVYVYAYYHQIARGGLPQVKLGNLTCFKREVKRFEIWQDSFFMSEALKMKVLQHPTLLDRDLIVTRFGAKGSQQVRRELEAAGESPMPEGILAQAQTLPSLEDVAYGRVTSLDGSGPAAPTVELSAAHEELALPQELAASVLSGEFQPGEAPPPGSEADDLPW
ncbi:hypothetical protein LCGC14_2502890 [marine sediment metagenome]|uniref:Tyrosine specific protein phosphatases domain-containing protein n=1 Tax=marine sediment metagenome TaxID=412755 RepID=A0A0F9DD68_9ZZZZ